MNAIMLAGPAVEPVSLAEIKAHLRLDTSDEDDLLLALLRAAREVAEAATRLRFVTQDWTATLPVRDPGPIRIPLAPLRSVASVTLLRPDQPASLLAPSTWQIEGGPDEPRLRLGPGVPREGGASVEIVLTVGFGAAPADVPAAIRLALRLLVASWFARRGDEPDGAGQGIPAEARALLAPFIRRRLA